MARVYAQTPETQPIAIAARDASGEIIASVAGVGLTLARNRSSVAGRLSQHFTIRGAPLSASNVKAAEAMGPLLEQLPGRLDPRTVYIRCYPDWDAPTVSILGPCGYVREDWLNLIVDLMIPEPQILARMSKHRRKGIRAAEKADLDLVHVSTTAELSSLYQLLADAHRRLLIPFQGRPLFEAVFREFVSRGSGLMLMAKARERLLAGRVLLLHGGIAYDWYAGSTPQAKRLHADEWLTWKAMVAAKNLGAVQFDFGGAGKPDEDYGPREFKRRFGGGETNIGRYTRVLGRVRFGFANLAQDVLRRI
jgi:serine/alanine adding enzyme